MTGGKVTVAGAGAFGLVIALELADAGLAVTVRDPAPLGRNASGIAAGMLAPAFETVLDPVSASHFPLLKASRDLWPALAERIGISLDRFGAVYRGSPDEEEVIIESLYRVGAQWERIPEGVFTPEDWRLDPRPTLEALREACVEAGVRFSDEAVAAVPEGETLVLATGWSDTRLAPELSSLSAIKGHILTLEGGPADGPVHRGRGVYVRPHEAGAVLGATMEAGRSDLSLDRDIIDALTEAGEALMSGTAALTSRAETGVRASTPDGLPLVGWSATPDVFVAAGARRNGWLLAPLVARLTRAYLTDTDPGPWASPMNARRFDPARDDHEETS